MRNTALCRLLFLVVALGLSTGSYSKSDPHIKERNNLIDAVILIEMEAERHLSWECDPQYQEQVYKIYDQWIPSPPPIGKYADSNFWHSHFEGLAGEYARFDCFDIAVELLNTALEAGKHESEDDLQGTRRFIEGLKADKREGIYDSSNPKHPHYGDVDYYLHEYEDGYEGEQSYPTRRPSDDKNSLHFEARKILYYADGARYDPDWDCDPQYQQKMLKVYDRWTPTHPTAKKADRTPWHMLFEGLASTYAGSGCFDIAIEFMNGVIEGGKYESKEDLKNMRDFIERLKAEKRGDI